MFVSFLVCLFCFVSYICFSFVANLHLRVLDGVSRPNVVFAASVPSRASVFLNMRVIGRDRDEEVNLKMKTTENFNV